MDTPRLRAYTAAMPKKRTSRKPTRPVGRPRKESRRPKARRRHTTRDIPSRGELIADAPAQFGPQWLDSIENQALKRHVHQAYMAIRRQQDDGTGISVLRDMLIRRIVYLERICNRLELAMEHWTDQYIAGHPNAEFKLLEYQRYYSYNAHVMRGIIEKIGLEDRSAVPQNTPKALTAPVRAAIMVPEEDINELED